MDNESGETAGNSLRIHSTDVSGSWPANGVGATAKDTAVQPRRLF